MSEIEKAREALVPLLRHRFLASGWLSDDADRLAGDDTKKVEAFVRAIAREEIEANEERPGHDKSPPAVETPAAGDPKEMAGRLRNIARDPNNFIPRAGSLIEAAVMVEDTTALARQLAEALNKVWLSGEPEAHEREVESALTEARKAGLIE